MVAVETVQEKQTTPSNLWLYIVNTSMVVLLAIKWIVWEVGYISIVPL